MIREATKEARFVPSTYEGCGRQRRQYNRQALNYAQTTAVAMKVLHHPAVNASCAISNKAVATMFMA